MSWAIQPHHYVTYNNVTRNGLKSAFCFQANIFIGAIGLCFPLNFYITKLLMNICSSHLDCLHIISACCLFLKLETNLLSFTHVEVPFQLLQPELKFVSPSLPCPFLKDLFPCFRYLTRNLFQRDFSFLNGNKKGLFEIVKWNANLIFISVTSAFLFKTITKSTL